VSVIRIEIDERVEDTPAGVLRSPTSSLSVTVPQRRAACRRRIDYRAGRALEMLGHAIEYLADELVEEGGSLTAGNARVQAIQILMVLNRQVYFECPIVPTLNARIRALLRKLF